LLIDILKVLDGIGIFTSYVTPEGDRVYLLEMKPLSLIVASAARERLISVSQFK
jgi:hypothetical protein